MWKFSVILNTKQSIHYIYSNEELFLNAHNHSLAFISAFYNKSDSFIKFVFKNTSSLVIDILLISKLDLIKRNKAKSKNISFEIFPPNQEFFEIKFKNPEIKFQLTLSFIEMSFLCTGISKNKLKSVNLLKTGFQFLKQPLKESKPDYILTEKTKFKFTKKMLYGLVNQIPLVLLENFEKCILERRFEEEELRETKFASELLKVYNKQIDRKELFKGIIFIFFDEKQFNVLSGVVELCNGKSILYRNSDENEDFLNTLRNFVLVEPKKVPDECDIIYFLKRGYRINKDDLIVKSVLTGDCIFRIHKMFFKRFKITPSDDLILEGKRIEEKIDQSESLIKRNKKRKRQVFRNLNSERAKRRALRRHVGFGEDWKENKQD